MSATWTMKLSRGLIKDILMANADLGLRTIGTRIEEQARELAPQRKVFAGVATPKSQGRVAGFRELLMLRRAMKKHTANPGEQSYRPSYRRKFGRVGLITVSARRRARLRDTAEQAASRSMIRASRLGYSYYGTEPLSARGKYEVRSGRAVIKTGGRRTPTFQLGGGLKRSIEASSLGPGLIEVRASVPYAKFVEFGTRRSVAQPFLLPAFKSSRNAFKKEIARAVGGKVK